MKLVFNDSDSHWNTDNVFQKLDEYIKRVQENGEKEIPSDLDAVWLLRSTLDDNGNLRVYYFQGTMDGWAIVWLVPDFLPKRWFRKFMRQENLDDANIKFFRLDYVNFSGGVDQNNLGVQDLTIGESKCLANRDFLGFGFNYDRSSDCIFKLKRLIYGYWSLWTKTAMYLQVDNSEYDQINLTGITDLLETLSPVRISLPFSLGKSSCSSFSSVHFQTCTLTPHNDAAIAPLNHASFFFFLNLFSITQSDPSPATVMEDTTGKVFFFSLRITLNPL